MKNTHEHLPKNLISQLYWLIKAMRPNHWVKNGVVFAGALFGFRFTLLVLYTAILAFMCFCAVASAIYLANDSLDVEADRKHPKKCKRPIAAGLVPIPMALFAATLLFIFSVTLSFWVDMWLGIIILAYTFIQIVYSTLFKHKTIVDLICIASGFVLRALGGTVAAQVIPSSWFILCVGLLALYLGIEKRKSELKALGDSGTTRQVLQHYSISWLLRMESVVTACALMTYMLWTIEGASTPWMMLTIPFVIYAIFKYQNLSDKFGGETPEETLLHSPHIMISLLMWVATSGFVLYASKLLHWF